MSVVFLLALGLVLLRGELHAPMWLGWLCMLVALGNVVVTWLAVTFSTYHGKGWNAVGFGAYVGFLVIVLMLKIACSCDVRKECPHQRSRPTPETGGWDPPADRGPCPRPPPAGAARRGEQGGRYLCAEPGEHQGGER